MKNRILLVAILLIFSYSGAVFAEDILTGSEKTNFSHVTSHAEMMEYLQELQSSSTDMLSGVFGKTVQGRAIPYAIYSRPLVTQGWEAMILNRPIIVLTANIHGEETNLRESILILMRKLAKNGSEENKLLDKLVVIIIPTLNVDGFVLNTHVNAAEINLNRDFIKAEQPEMISYIREILHKWHPHLFVDGHGGGPYPYNLCYQGPGNAAGDMRITDLFDMQIKPFIDAKMNEAGYKSWYFQIGDRKQWTSGISDADNGRNYGGLINCMGILFESPASQDLRTAALSGVVGYRAVLQYAAANADELMAVVNRARRETIELGQSAKGKIAVRMEKVAENYPVSYEVSVKRNEAGQMDVVKDEGDAIEKVAGAKLIKKPKVTKTRPRPYAYILGPDAKEAIEMLKRQMITIEILREDTKFKVEAYQLKGIDHGKKYERDIAPIVTVAGNTKTIKPNFPKGSYVIRTGQVMGRVICHMLEPETDDNVITFNAMDKQLTELDIKNLVPIYKIMKPTKMPTVILDY